uniref:Beta-carotene isomerase D27-like C-terminal domain-containing protein n=3 Tax=Ditylum brightwellii TaxID=49249 RepID=A0A7S4VAG1_9STRA|mmetsp:Transcript_18620/g.24821  ORF Transcript_18620/g.24821 Transcript_18620/m.24821 type:complete len:340 (+) Transcript_18620:112-1131(+)
MFPTIQLHRMKIICFLLFLYIPTTCSFLTPTTKSTTRTKSSTFTTTTQHCNRARIICHERTTTTGTKYYSKTIEGPPIETRPNYENIHGPLGKMVDNACLVLFRTKFAEQVGIDSKLPKDDYKGLMELTTALNARYSDRTQVQLLAQEVLKSLFPAWLLSQFIVMFAKPFPVFSAKLNALATAILGTWLMGECEVNDCEIDNPNPNSTEQPPPIGKNQGVLVKRCRFLEESNCASVCVNSCKIPTQKFFIENMGVPLTMTPDYETGECQFAFGLTPTTEELEGALNTPCLQRCPSLGGMRKWHDDTVGKNQGKGSDLIMENGSVDEKGGDGSQCFLMEN